MTRPSSQSSSALKFTCLRYQVGVPIKNNCHENIYRKNSGKPHHGGGKVIGVKMQMSGLITLQTFLWILLRISRYIVETPDQISQQYSMHR